ncbi:hypothetical protein DPMN_170444 [Dreissena polymorpha]|uniref:VWFA domain-containing protein n=1 Tax=Dreissena polymorpha TaxID=45954 RepID=A0A9D4DYE5_DREPO|nr:hypothetical protein DPMN_170444 [Dreissena polymorpha]
MFPDCGSKPADIVFLLDSSGSVDKKEFKIQLDFVANFSQAFDIGLNNVRIGVVTFESEPRTVFNLTKHNNKEDLYNAIAQITKYVFVSVCFIYYHQQYATLIL